MLKLLNSWRWRSYSIILRRFQMIDYIYKREVTSKCGEGKRLCEENAACHVPDVLQERELSGTNCYDKVFAAAWLDYVNIVLGTKDNKLLLVDSQKDRSVEIDLPRRSVRSTDGVHSCGIHSIESSLNISKSLLATGADNPSDVAVFSLPSFEPVQLLKKHDDWLFASAWLTDTVLATGSRDSTVKIWSVNGNKSFINGKPIVDRRDHRDKVRDLKYCELSESLGTLSGDGTCKIWDPHIMEVVSTVQMHYKRDLQCLAVEYPLLAVGSQNYISFIDMRCGHITKHVDSLDDGWGVRSLSFRGPLVTCGGGKGRISFFELRAMKYLILPAKASNTNRKEFRYLNTGKGFLDANDASTTSFHGQFQWHAVYAHSYDVTGTSLLTVGGPIIYGQRGCYAAVW